MRAQHFIPFVGAWFLLALAGGCATNQLWTGTGLDDWNEPADEPHLKLFQTPDKRNFLVVYDEYSERNDSTHTRAYLLNPNEKRIHGGHAPWFSNTNLAHGLAAVPVFSPSASPAPGTLSLFAVKGNQCFTLYQNARTNVYDLPVYNDGKGTLERAALTPLTLTADATVIGGLFWFEMGCPGLANSP